MQWMTGPYSLLDVVHEFIPRDGSPLKNGNAAVKIDHTISVALQRECWQIEELEFTKRVCIGSDPITLVDIGANVGLFSRQVLIAIPAVATVFAYEPEPRNFEFMAHNLAPFGTKVKAARAAISNCAGTVEFYLDPTNSANNSIAINAMPSVFYRKITVEARDAAIESSAWMNAGARIFYKSDTEGFDELIAIAVGANVWPHIFAGLIEIWNIHKPPFDRAAFAGVLDRFPQKVFLANRDTRVSEISVSTGDVLRYINSGNRLHRDLAFWR
jgi:FkbM family methyltransferase